VAGSNPFAATSIRPVLSPEGFPNGNRLQAAYRARPNGGWAQPMRA